MLQMISKHIEAKKVLGSSQHWFTKQRSRPPLWWDDTSGLVEEGGAMVIICVDLSKALNAVSHNICTDKLMKYGLDKWTGVWIEN